MRLRSRTCTLTFAALVPLSSHPRRMPMEQRASAGRRARSSPDRAQGLHAPQRPRRLLRQSLVHACRAARLGPVGRPPAQLVRRELVRTCREKCACAPVPEFAVPILRNRRPRGLIFASVVRDRGRGMLSTLMLHRLAAVAALDCGARPGSCRGRRERRSDRGQDGPRLHEQDRPRRRSGSGSTSTRPSTRCRNSAARSSTFRGAPGPP